MPGYGAGEGTGVGHSRDNFDNSGSNLLSWLGPGRGQSSGDSGRLSEESGHRQS